MQTNRLPAAPARGLSDSPMPEYFKTLIHQYEASLIRAWVDEMYADPRVSQPTMLSYGQLINHLPELLDELAHVIESAATDAEMIEASRRLRSHAQVRFHQGVLIDEVARELMIFRKVFEDFLWREGINAIEGEMWRLRDALRLTGRLIDEVIAQTVVTYAASLRPPVETRTSVWPPPRRRKTDFPQNDER